MNLKTLQVWQRLVIGFLGFMVIMPVFATLAASTGIGIPLIIALLLAYPVFFYHIAFKKDKKILIRCPNCKYEGIGELKAKGSFAVEIVLWLLLLVPGIIYSVWRLSNRRFVCPQCNFDHVVKIGPVRSP